MSELADKFYAIEDPISGLMWGADGWVDVKKASREKPISIENFATAEEAWVRVGELGKGKVFIWNAE